jgi:hypothetical protein
MSALNMASKQTCKEEAMNEGTKSGQERNQKEKRTVIC